MNRTVLESQSGLSAIEELELLQSSGIEGFVGAKPVDAPGHIEKASNVMLNAVRESFPAPHFVVLGEVRDSTGFDSERSADALAQGMYRSRGRELHGFEFKASRSDWLRELRMPAKAESWFAECDRWALIVLDDTIAKPEELPPGWGLGKVHNGKVKWIVKPPKLDPVPLSRNAFAAFLHRAIQQEHREEKEIADKAYADGKAEAEQTVKLQADGMARMLAQVNAFESAAGLSLVRDFDSLPDRDRYAKTIGAAIQSLRGRRPEHAQITSELNRCAEGMEEEARRMRKRVAQLEEGIESMARLQKRELDKAANEQREMDI